MHKLIDIVESNGNYHIVITLINGMGDAFLALPVIRYLSEHVGEGRITVWGRRSFLNSVYAELGHTFLPLSESPTSPAIDLEYELKRLRGQIPVGRVICWVSLNSYATPAVEEYAIARLSPMYYWHYGAPGVRTDDDSGKHLHRLDQYFRVIGEKAIPRNVNRRPHIGDLDDCFAREMRQKSVSRSKCLIAIHAETSIRKQWLLGRWVELGAKLTGVADLVLLGREGQTLGKNRDFQFYGEAWGIQVAIIRNAHFFVGIDSCFAHVADSYNVPGVVMFSNTDVSASEMIDRWGPKSGALIALASNTGDLQDLRLETVLESLAIQGLKDWITLAIT